MPFHLLVFLDELQDREGTDQDQDDKDVSCDAVRTAHLGHPADIPGTPLVPICTSLGNAIRMLDIGPGIVGFII